MFAHEHSPSSPSALSLNVAPLDDEASTRPEISLDVSVVVPVLSEDGEVRQVYQALGSELDREGRSWEILFVFDGVQGAAWEKVEALRAEHGQKVRSIHFKNPFGESVCLSAAVEKARGAVIVTSPQYVQIDPIELGDMLAEI